MSVITTFIFTVGLAACLPALSGDFLFISIDLFYFKTFKLRVCVLYIYIYYTVA